MQCNIWSWFWLLNNWNLLIQTDIILFYWVLQYPAVVCGERAVCCVEAGGPDSQLRSEDEKETAGEECVCSGMDGCKDGRHSPTVLTLDHTCW